MKSVGRRELPSDIGRRFGELVTAAVENSAKVTRCPVCDQPATLIDGDPTGDWCRVGGCRCEGFFVATDCLEWRLPRLSPDERVELSMTIQGFGAMGRDAWLSTADGIMSGRLVIRTKRPSDAA